MAGEAVVEGLDKGTQDFFNSGGETAPEEEAVVTEVEKTEEPPKKPEGGRKDPPDVEKENLKRAMHEEREKRKAERAEREALQAQVRTQEEKLNRFLEIANRREPPKFEEDPAGNLKAEVEDLKAQLRLHGATASQLAQQEQARANDTRLTQAVQAREAAFAQTNPDYYDAAKHVVAMQKAQLEVIGIPEAEINSRVMMWAKAISAQALQQERDPAEVFYAMAQKLGFKKSDAGEQAKTTLETLAKGQEAAKGLPSGKAPEGITLAKIAQMDEDEMEELVSKQWGKVAKLMK